MSNVDGEQEAIVSVTLTPSARKKLNQVAAENASAESLADYVGLLRYLDGVRSLHVMMVVDHLGRDEVCLHGLTMPEATRIVQAIEQAALPPK
jgi:hypothetical protein